MGARVTEPIDITISRGARIVQAAKLVTTKMDKIIMFTGLLLVSWVISWEKGITYAITPTVTSYFESNNISGVLGIVLSILQTALQPMYSKLSDMTGRATAYTVSIVFFIVSFVVMACANSYNTLIGGQVIYAFGYSGIYILGPILIGDTTGLVNRTLFLAIYNFPIIVNLFSAGAAAQRFLDAHQWRWGFGHITIVIFAASLPLITVLWNIQRKAKNAGLLSNKGSSSFQHIQKEEEEEQASSSSTNVSSFKARSQIFMENIVWLIVEIDLIGSLLLIAGLFLILLPLTLAPTWGGWDSSSSIGTLASGGVTWILFAFWESKCAKKPIIPMKSWESKNPLWGTLTMFMIWTINNMMDLQYFLNYLQVTRRVLPETAAYLERGFNCANVILPIFIGYFIRHTRRWRPFVWMGACLAVLGSGLMIPARNSHSPDVFIVFAQIIFGSACGFLNYPILVGIQGSVPHKDIAIVIALFEVGISVAGSVGTAIAGAVWNSVLLGILKKYVPGEYNYLSITKSIQHALALPEDQYKGVVLAYDDAMCILGIAAVCMGALAFLLSTQLKGYVLEDFNKESPDEQEVKTELDEEIDIADIRHSDTTTKQVATNDNKQILSEK